MIQGHLQGQKVKYQGQLSKINMCNTLCNFDWAFHIFKISQRGQFQGEVRENIIFNK